MKRPSEAEFGKALRGIDLLLEVYRPPDPKGPEGVSNFKPCDFMVWLADGTGGNEGIWFECKDVDAVEAFSFAELRPSQLSGIHNAARVGIPYWLAVWWRRSKTWSISDAVMVLDWRESVRVDLESDTSLPHDPPTSIPRTLLISRFGVESSKQQLGSTLKQVLLGEAD